MDPTDNPPEPTLPPAEQMRQKRLAMLNKANTEATLSKPDSQEQPKSKIQPAPSTAAAKIAKPNAPNENERPVKKSMTQDGTVAPEASGPPAKKINAKEEPIEAWSDRILTDIFRVTLDETRMVDSRGNPLILLPQLRDELRASGDPLKLTAQTIDSVILEAASSISQKKALLGSYLLPCFKRTVRAISGLRRPTEERQAVLDEAKRLCMSNCLFALSMPELFGREGIHESLGPYLLRSHDSEEGLCLDFFNEAVGHIKEEPETAAIFIDAMIDLSSKLATMSMDGDYKPYINCLRTYARYPSLLDALAQHPRFLVQTTSNMTKEQLAVSSETQTILGPFFRISPLQPEVTKTYFASPRTIDPGHVKTSQSALQMTLKAHQDDLIAIINAFVRASTAARNRVLDWFSFALNTNHKRRAMQLNPKDVASDGFMINLTVILDQLCEPFMDASYSKISKVDIEYLRRSPRVDISDETKLNADQATSDNFYGKKADGTSNFISEVFFLNLAAHHYGSEATNSKLKELAKDIKYFERHEKEIREQIAKMNPNHPQIKAAKAAHDKVISVLEKSITLKFSIEGILTDKSMQTRSLQFMRYVTVWLLRVASCSPYVPGQKLSLPLPVVQPDEFRCLPEYALQDVVDNFKFVSRFIPEVMMSAVGEEIVALCITFLRSSEYIKNPYLKSSLVTLLFTGSLPTFHLSRGVLGDILLGSGFAHEHLLHSLMKFYIECEHSGVSSAFYDRFNIRYEIFQVIKVIWPNNIYREKLGQESKSNRQFFVQFVNLLLNDATYLLDEALGKLAEIHDYQTQLLDNSLSAEDREKVEKDLEDAEGRCQSWMGLVNETMAMMKLFTETLADAFTMPEIVSRLASMLNYNLDVLVGPKRGNLKVQDNKKYKFEPKTLLSEITDIYLNLGSKQPFIEALAADGRSYKPANFDTASALFSSKYLKAPEEISKWNTLKGQVAKAKEALDQAELDLGDVPPEFEDPIMGILMTDPVMLPSKAIVDRSTIVQQLLSDPRDPFSRNPMTMDDVVPADELRAKIEVWKSERIAAAKADAANAMDTTAG